MVTHRGGSGRWVEGERVFAPPAGSFDPDWVAGIVLDRLGERAGERTVLARAALAVRDGDADGRAARAVAAGVDAEVAAAVVAAVADFAAAYGLDD